MADRYFSPSATHLGQTASWSSSLYGSTGASVPEAGDNVFFMRGSPSITEGLDALDLALANVSFGSQFSGTLGTPGASAIIGSVGSVVCDAKSAHIYAAAGSDNIASLTVNMIGGEFRITAGTVAASYIRAGIVRYSAGSVATAVYAMHAGSMVDLASSATAVTTLLVTDGARVNVMDRELTTTTISGERSRVLVEGTAAMTTVNLNGGNLNKRSIGNVTTFNQNGGLFTPSNAVQAYTVSTLNKWGGRFISTAGGVVLTVSTANIFDGMQPESVAAPGDFTSGQGF